MALGKRNLITTLGISFTPCVKCPAIYADNPANVINWRA